MRQKCQTESCQRAANTRVFWPGKLTRMCIPCAARAMRLADTMGFQLIIEEIHEESPPEDEVEH